ncbi:MAG: hypothetical protein WAV93_03860 [Bacteroidales bacterium]
MIKSLPVSYEKADGYGFSKKITFLDKSSLKTKKVDSYYFDGELFNPIEIVATIPLEGKE